MSNNKINLYRLIYASKIKPELMNDPVKVSATTKNILKSARSHNPSVGVNGVLFYGEGFFFQCLEGPENHVEALFKRINSDSRHVDITVLLASHIDRKYFAQWSMKLVENDRAVGAHLADMGLRYFNPFLFDSKTTNSLIKLFININ